MHRRHILTAVLTSPALAQVDFPERPPRIIVPAAAGGSQDSVARLLARFMAAPLGRPIIIENRAGAAGNIGFEFVARARPDGLILAAGSDNLSINKALFSGLSFDPVEDFAPVAQGTQVPQILVVRADSPSADLAGFLARAGREPLAVATGGNGSLAHLLLEQLARASDSAWTHVPYRGGALALNDLMGGQLQGVLINIGAVTEHVRAGRLRGLVVSTESRAGALPQVPTLTEVGLAPLTIVGWHGLVAPAGTDPAIIARLNTASRASVKRAELAERLAGLGVEPTHESPEALAAAINSDALRYAELVRRFNIRSE
jgi:tripartite-type tricarboxylate transporter receptor subunit TctC